MALNCGEVRVDKFLLYSMQDITCSVCIHRETRVGYVCFNLRQHQLDLRVTTQINHGIRVHILNDKHAGLNLRTIWVEALNLAVKCS